MEWLSRQPTCPVDRTGITTSELQPVPRILKIFLQGIVLWVLFFMLTVGISNLFSTTAMYTLLKTFQAYYCM